MEGLETKRFGSTRVVYRPGTSDERVLDHSFGNDLFFKELPYLKLSKDPVILDVGAHIGTFSLLSAIRYPNARVFAFEANNETHTILESNIRINGLQDRVTSFQQAMAGKAGNVRLYHNEQEGNWGHAITKKLSDSYEEVECVTMGQVMKNVDSTVDLVKFNCEGAEFEIILNSPPDLLRDIGCAVVLYHEDMIENKYSYRDIVEHFATAGHRCVLLHQKKDRGWIIAVNSEVYNAWLFTMAGKIKRRLVR